VVEVAAVAQQSRPAPAANGGLTASPCPDEKETESGKAEQTGRSLAPFISADWQSLPGAPLNTVQKPARRIQVQPVRPGPAAGRQSRPLGQSPQGLAQRA